MLQDDIRNKAKELLDSDKAGLVIGYCAGTGTRRRPAFIKKQDDVSQLIFDEHCKRNLAVYLNKPEVRALGKPAIVAPLPALRTLNQLRIENQIAESDIEIIGVSENEGTLIDIADFQALREYVSEHPNETPPELKKKFDMISAMPREERWQFWEDTVSACIKCYACRESCPLCYCNRCSVECNQPQWVSVPSHDLGNMEYHVMRAMHLAGRCVQCGECVRACPVGIPLGLLAMQAEQTIKEHFAPVSDEERAEFLPLSVASQDDTEDFFR